MIVDDNELIREKFREVLKPVASDLVECSSGEEAVTRFEIDRPDWVIMDLILNGIDGLEAAKQIRARHPEAAILIVALSDQPSLRQAAEEVGCVALLSKKQISEVRTIIESASLVTTTEEARR
jgi:CheY-like chemotaxis protein